jgi:predicted amidophosphoribosyltransferase
MSPRVIESRRCPHCKAELPEPTPRVCPSCMGSLQKRHLSLGCLSSAPPVVLALFGAIELVRALLGRG